MSPELRIRGRRRGNSSPSGNIRRCTVPKTRLLAVICGLTLLSAGRTEAQVVAKAQEGPATPAWDKGIQPISRESYYNAIECGKQPGARPACVFYDADLCKNGDFALTFFTPYKMVSYSVWQAVSHKQPPPQPDYGAAQRTRVTLGITPVKGSKNPIAGLNIKRGGKVIKPATETVDEAGGRFIFDPQVFAPTGELTIEMIGKSSTRTCRVPVEVLKTFR